MSIRVRERSKRLAGKSKSEHDYLERDVISEDGSTDKSTVAERPVSTTLLQLIAQREQASDRYIKADRAQKAYFLNRQATMGQEGFKDAKHHFKETASHFKMGCKGLIVATTALPSIIGDSGKQRKKRSDARRRERIMENQKKLQDALDKTEKAG